MRGIEAGKKGNATRFVCYSNGVNVGVQGTPTCKSGYVSCVTFLSHHDARTEAYCYPSLMGRVKGSKQ